MYTKFQFDLMKISETKAIQTFLLFVGPPLYNQKSTDMFSGELGEAHVGIEQGVVHVGAFEGRQFLLGDKVRAADEGRVPLADPFTLHNRDIVVGSGVETCR